MQIGRPGLVIEKRILIGAAAVVTAVGLLTFFYDRIETAYDSLFQFEERDTLSFYCIFIGLLIIGCLTSILPASILGVFSGALFGITKGFLVSAVSFMLASMIAFSFARYCFRSFSREVVGKFFDLEKLDANFARSGWKYALFLRLSPIAPFGITSYGLGLTPISWYQYVLTTFGTFPFLLACVCLGKVTGTIVGGHGEFDRALLWELIALFTIGSVLAVLAIWLLPRLVLRRADMAQGDHD
jgi:uncharacterized membrane protein YdjX (TVP38/TMEM64 family)